MNIQAWSVQQFDEELLVESDDRFWNGGIVHLFTDDDGRHWIGGASSLDDTAATDAGAAIIRAINDDGTMIDDTVRQFDTELALQANDHFGEAGIAYLFTDTDGNHRLGGGSASEDTAWSNAGAALIWAVDDNGNYITGSTKQFDTELSLSADDAFGTWWIIYLFTDDSGHHRLGGTAPYSDIAADGYPSVDGDGFPIRVEIEAADDAGASIVRAVDDDGNYVWGSANTLSHVLWLQSTDYFGQGGLSYLFEDEDGNHWIGGGAAFEDTYGGNAWAAIIRAINDDGELVNGTLKQFDTELPLNNGDLFGYGGISHLFTDGSGNHRLGGASHSSDIPEVTEWFAVVQSAAPNAWAAIIRAVSDTGAIVSGSAQKLDTELDLWSSDFFGEHGISSLFTDDSNRHRVWGGISGRQGWNGEGWVVIRAMSDTGSFLEDTVISITRYTEEFGIEAWDEFGSRWVEYLLTTEEGNYLLWADSAGSSDGAENGWAAVIWTLEESVAECEELDCDDTDGSNYPNNTERCDDQDNDCDEAIDEVFECRSVARKSSTWISWTSTKKTASSPTSPKNEDSQSNTKNSRSESTTKNKKESAGSDQSDKTSAKHDQRDERRTHKSADSATTETSSSVFTDVPATTSYADAAQFLTEKWVIEIITDENDPEKQRFSPFRTVTQGEFYKMIVGLLYDHTLSEDAPLKTYAVFLKKHGIVAGYTVESLESAVDLSEVIRVIAAILIEQGKDINENALPETELWRTIKRREIAEILDKLITFMLK